MAGRSVSTYLVPILSGDGYVEVDTDTLIFVDIHCKICRTRMQRFCCPGPGKPVGVQPFRKRDTTVASPFTIHDGEPRWHLTCHAWGCGHQRPISGREVVALLELVSRGELPECRAHL